jgi:hypothetical protein
MIISGAFDVTNYVVNDPEQAPLQWSPSTSGDEQAIEPGHDEEHNGRFQGTGLPPLGQRQDGL